MALQSQLLALGYWLGDPPGTYGDLTGQAVLAFQKVTGLPRTSAADAATQSALSTATRPTAGAGPPDRIDVSIDQQVLQVVAGGQVVWTINTSTGSGATFRSRGHMAVAVTPKGTWQVYREVNAWDRSPLGQLYRPKYFRGGIAVHGYPSVPATPASHGCVRVSLKAMDLLWQGALPVGATVVVH